MTERNKDVILNFDEKKWYNYKNLRYHKFIKFSFYYTLQKCKSERSFDERYPPLAAFERKRRELGIKGYDHDENDLQPHSLFNQNGFKYIGFEFEVYLLMWWATYRVIWIRLPKFNEAHPRFYCGNYFS